MTPGRQLPRPPPLFPLAEWDRRSRHEARVRQFSSGYQLLAALRTLGTDPEGAASLIDHVCGLHEVPGPAVTFHGARSSYTGYCLAPGWRVRLTVGPEALLAWERRKGQAWPEQGMIRLGKRPALGTIAHELGHHLVNHLEPPSAPAHGRAWVAWFDAAAAGIVDWCRYHGLDLDRRGERPQAKGHNRRVRDPVPAAGA